MTGTSHSMASVPQRTNARQRIVYLAKRHLAGTNAIVTESKLLPDLDDGRLREVDVVIDGSVGGEAVTIGIEVLDRARRVDKEIVEARLNKHRRLPVNKLVIISWSGFTKGALAKIGACDGWALAVTPQDRDLREPVTLYFDTIKLTPEARALVVMNGAGERTLVRQDVDGGINLYDESGALVGNLADLTRELLTAEGVLRHYAKEFHTHPERGSLVGFEFGMTSLDTSGLLHPLFLRWENTGELHRLIEFHVKGRFSGEQTKLDFKGLLLGEQFVGVANGRAFGHDAVWVASQVDDENVTISWQAIDAPANPTSQHLGRREGS